MMTKKGDEMRNQIIEASGQLFMEKSVSKVTINDIVQRVGIAKGTFYLYFDSKETLVWCFIDTKLSGLNTYLSKLNVDSYEKEDIEHLITCIVSFLNMHKPLIKLLHHVRFFTYLGFHNMEEKSLNTWIDALYSWLMKGRSMGKLTIDNPRFMAYFLVVTIHEVLERAIIEEKPFTVDDASDELKQLVVKLLK